MSQEEHAITNVILNRNGDNTLPRKIHYLV